MARSERVKSLGGPGGLRCPCCGGGKGHNSGPVNRRALVKRHRRRERARSIAEGWADRSDTTPKGRA